MKTMLKKSTIKKLKADSKVVMAALQAEAKQRRFLIGSHNAIKLEKSLAAVDRLDLVGRTLLDPEIHKAHAARLNKRLQARWEKIKTKADSDWRKLPRSAKSQVIRRNPQEVAASHLRFLTLVDSVTAVDARAGLKAAKKLKEKLTTTLDLVSGLTCLGAIEVEVVSMKLMREIKKKDTQSASETRKLDVCEALAEKLSSTVYSNDESLFLVHFHGVVTATSPEKFDLLYKQLRKSKSWVIAPRQIELKKLSEEYAGKAKSVEKNLEHIATYITKGGNDWYARKAYLRYKIGFEADEATDENEWVAKNWRRDRLLRAEHAEDGIEDLFSLTADEIGQLAVLIDGLMGLARDRTGYALNVV